MVAFFAAITIARWRARKEGIDPNKITDLGIYIVCAGILGARVFYIIQFFDDYRNNLLSIFKVYEGGLVYYGDCLPLSPPYLFLLKTSPVLP